MNLQFRGDFVNIFNRIAFPNPVTTNPQNPITRNSLGYVTGGFGTMSTYTSPGSGTFTGRTGTLLLRFSFQRKATWNRYRDLDSLVIRGRLSDRSPAL